MRTATTTDWHSHPLAEGLVSPSPTDVAISADHNRQESSDLHVGPTDASVRGRIFARHRFKITLAYALLVIENTLRIMQPFVIGWAVNDLIHRSWSGLMALVVQHLAYLIVGSGRQMFETRLINRLTAAAATDVLTDEQPRATSSPVPGKLAALRESAQVLECVVPRVMHIAFSLFGAVVMLGWYDMALVPLCLVLLVPAFLLNAAYGRKCALLGNQLWCEYEREADVVATGKARDLRRHLEGLAQWRVKLSDAETTNFCLMELFVLGVLAAALVHYCLNQTPPAGDVFAMLQYVLLFIAGLRGIPFAAGHLARSRRPNVRVS